MFRLLTRIQRRAMRAFRSTAMWLRSRPWPNHSRLLLVCDGLNWSLSEDLKAIWNYSAALCIKTKTSNHFGGAPNQGVFFASLLGLINWQPWRSRSRCAAAFFHGTPGTGDPNFDHQFNLLTKHHEHITALQVTNTAFREIVLTSGIAPEKLHLIPIGIDLARYDRQTPESRCAVRDRLEIPQDAVVIGSFQKDGIGWDEGLEPKLVKGPDIFLEVIDQIRAEQPNLFVLLSGPARGYVKAGLDKMGVPHRHLLFDDARDVDALYQAIDLYLVTSRDEGGPKAVMESMASGVPLVSTRVGMAPDLIAHGESGWLADVEDVDSLSRHTREALVLSEADRGALLEAAHASVQRVDHAALLPQWRGLFSTLVDPEHIGDPHA